MFNKCILLLLISPVMAEETTDASWQQFHKDANNTGYSPSSAPDTNQLLWESDAINAVGASSPVVAGDKVFVNCDDGSVLWSYYLDAGIKSSLSLSLQGDDVYIYFTSAAEDGSLFCLMDNGTEAELKWEYNPEDDSEYILQGASISDGNVYFGTDTGYLYCITEGDWNPWYDLDSAGYPDGTYITSGEVIAAYNCRRYTSPAPETGELITSGQVIALYNAWRFTRPM
jgi:PKD repeat protein